MPIDFTQYTGLWLIEPSAARDLVSRIRLIDLAAHVSAYEQLKSEGNANGQARTPHSSPGNGKAAVVSLSGVMSKHGSSMAPNGSTVAMRKALRTAAADDRYKSIVAVFDTPGGTLSGTQALASDIRNISKSKPVYTVGDDMVASAGYWGALQGSKFYAVDKPTIVGSIGSFMGVYDESKAFEKEGVKAVVFSTGKYKGSLFPGTEINEEQIAYYQGLVNELQTHFSSAVMEGRNMDKSKLESLADGRVWTAEEAVKLGLIDGVKSLDEVIAEAEAVNGTSLSVSMNVREDRVWIRSQRPSPN